MDRKQTETLRIAIGPIVGEYGGVAQHVRNIIRYSRYTLTAIIPSSFSLYYSQSQAKGYTKAVLNKFGFKDFDPVGLFLSKFYLPRFNVVHLHGHPYWPAIYQKPRYRRAKYIHTVHQIYLQEDSYTPEEWRDREYLNQLMFESCQTSDVVISVAKWQQKLLAEVGIDSSYIPNGIDIQASETADPARFRQKYGLSEEFYIFTGDIRRYKRPALFIELAKLISSKRFVMIGNGVTQENLVMRLKTAIPPNVICLGVLSPQDALNAIAASKVFVLTSKNDTFPSTLLEAMACKKAVVVANNAGPKEIVTDSVDGFLFEPDNIDDLYEKALIAWDHPEVGIQAYKEVKEKYDWPMLSKKIDNLYARLCEGKVPTEGYYQGR